MPQQHKSLDQVFRAISDPTRRAVLKQLTKGKATCSELAEPFSMALLGYLFITTLFGRILGWIDPETARILLNTQTKAPSARLAPRRGSVGLTGDAGLGVE